MGWMTDPEDCQGLTVYLDLPDLVWDQTTDIVQIGSFPNDSGLLFFLQAAWQQITLDQFVVEVVRQGYWYSLPFMRDLHLALLPVKT